MSNASKYLIGSWQQCVCSWACGSLGQYSLACIVSDRRVESNGCEALCPRTCDCALAAQCQQSLRFDCVSFCCPDLVSAPNADLFLFLFSRVVRGADASSADPFCKSLRKFILAISRSKLASCLWSRKPCACLKHSENSSRSDELREGAPLVAQELPLTFHALFATFRNLQEHAGTRFAMVRCPQVLWTLVFVE